MKPCLLCHKPFIPRQTFETLFTVDRICQSCKLALKRPMMENHVPLKQNVLMVFTFEAKENEAFLTTLFTRIAKENIWVLFYEEIKEQDTEVWRLLKTLMRPFIIFHSDFMTMDVLQNVEGRLENEI